MPLNVKNAEAHRLAKELSELTGESITEVVTTVLREAVDRARKIKNSSTERLVAELDDIARHCASLEVLDERSAEEILGYDDRGLPG
jgi:antitoxin VapB